MANVPEHPDARSHGELHDELLETPVDRYLDWLRGLPGVFRIVAGCGTMLVAFLLGMLAWGLLLEFVF